MQVEISARDIRVRLSLRETEKPTSIHKANKELDRVVKPTHLGVDEDLNGGSSVSNNEIASGSQWNRDISQRKTEDSSARLLAVSSKVRDLFVKTLPLRDGWESIQVSNSNCLFMVVFIKKLFYFKSYQSTKVSVIYFQNQNVKLFYIMFQCFSPSSQSK